MPQTFSKMLRGGPVWASGVCWRIPSGFWAAKLLGLPCPMAPEFGVLDWSLKRHGACESIWNPFDGRPELNCEFSMRKIPLRSKAPSMRRVLVRATIFGPPASLDPQWFWNAGSLRVPVCPPSESPNSPIGMFAWGKIRTAKQEPPRRLPRPRPVAISTSLANRRGPRPRMLLPGSVQWVWWVNSSARVVCSTI